ncbi:hypothetical protein MESS2_1650026 [Mesorhizobium metallidurans STM 2683]|uniref:Uncharacterized protein n=1 Tax=Mesorhizobium metallidurans STM 2683 TaxID=1297569 RepID=M5ENM1_9HYPH|nr:hypothetical protein MESS2_1650026 [Mesorhizobium metallidurans STM 2683]
MLIIPIIGIMRIATWPVRCSAERGADLSGAVWAGAPDRFEGTISQRVKETWEKAQHPLRLPKLSVSSLRVIGQLNADGLLGTDAQSWIPRRAGGSRHSSVSGRKRRPSEPYSAVP